MNKMDLVDYEQAALTTSSPWCRRPRRDWVLRTWPPSHECVRRDNVTGGSESMPWYSGPTLLEFLSDWEPAVAQETAGFRFPVQSIVRARATSAATRERWSRAPFPLATRSPLLIRGERREWTGSSPTTGTARAVPHRAVTGQAVTITLDHEVDVTRGDVLAGKDPDGATLQPADRYSADMVWIGEEPWPMVVLPAGVGPCSVPVTVTNVRHRLDVVSGHESAAGTGDERYWPSRSCHGPSHPDGCLRQVPRHRCFLLVDRVTADTVAAGWCGTPCRAFNVVPHEYDVTDQATALMGHPSRVVWLTGLLAGKSTIAD